jgi:hypothetical protein
MNKTWVLSPIWAWLQGVIQASFGGNT